MAEFTVSIEFIDGMWRLCPLGDYPEGFQNVHGFATVSHAENWLMRWAEQRRLTLTGQGRGPWRVSHSAPKETGGRQ